MSPSMIVHPRQPSSSKLKKPTPGESARVAKETSNTQQTSDTKENAKTTTTSPTNSSTLAPAKKNHTNKHAEEEHQEKFEAFVKKSTALIAALHKRRDIMTQSRRANQEIVHQISEWTKGTPLAAPAVISMDDKEDTEFSYSGVCKALDQSCLLYGDQFEEKIMDYAIEWQQLVTLKFTSCLEQVQVSRRSLDHYTKKVQHMQQRNSSRFKQQDREKLERNQDKLDQAARAFGKHKRNLDLLTNVLLENSWKDLYPLLVHLMEHDLNSAQDRALVLSDFSTTLNDLSFVARTYGLNLQGRNATDLWRSLRLECQSSGKLKQAPGDAATSSEKGSDTATSWNSDHSFEQAWATDARLSL